MIGGDDGDIKNGRICTVGGRMKCVCVCVCVSMCVCVCMSVCVLSNLKFIEAEFTVFSAGSFPVG